MTESAAHPTFGDIPLVYDEHLPNVCYLIPMPPTLPNETLVEYRQRQALLGVKIVNPQEPKP